MFFFCLFFFKLEENSEPVCLFMLKCEFVNAISLAHTIHKTNTHSLLISTKMISQYVIFVLFFVCFCACCCLVHSCLIRNIFFYKKNCLIACMTSWYTMILRALWKLFFHPKFVTFIYAFYVITNMITVNILYAALTFVYLEIEEKIWQTIHLFDQFAFDC